MDSNSDSDAYRRFCGKNIAELNCATEDAKKVHLQRKINVEMYHAMCSRFVWRTFLRNRVKAHLYGGLHFEQGSTEVDHRNNVAR